MDIKINKSKGVILFLLTSLTLIGVLVVYNKTDLFKSTYKYSNLLEICDVEKKQITLISFVEGALMSFASSITGSKSAVNNQREIHYSNMGLFPVLLVDNSAKYGLFGKYVFGTQVYIFKGEIGWKPY